jgi:hypothetical protein
MVRGTMDPDGGGTAKGLEAATLGGLFFSDAGCKSYDRDAKFSLSHTLQRLVGREPAVSFDVEKLKRRIPIRLD